MHIGITDQHREDHPPNKFICVLIARLGPQHRSEVGIAVAFVFVIGKSAENLREILHMNALPSGAAVKPLHSQRFPC